MALLLFTCVVAGLIILLFRQWSSIGRYWRQRGLSQPITYPLVGNMMEYILKKKTMGEVFTDIGECYINDPLIGVYNFTKPAVLVNDPEYAQLVLVKEFSSFINRSEEMKMEERRPLDKNLFFITGTDWKAVRSKLTPVFSTGKLKEMLPTIESIFDLTFKDVPTNSIELVNFIELFTVRVRASCVFGIDMANSQIEQEFHKKVKLLAAKDVLSFLRTTIALWFPKIASVFNLSIFGRDNEDFFVKILLNSFKERAESKTVRHDFIQTLLELKNTGTIHVKQWLPEDDILRDNDNHQITETVAIDDDILVAQSFIFLVAGLEPLLSTISMLLVELSQNQDAAEKLRDEVDRVLGKHQQFSYSALKEMEYLELCLKETMRLHTPAEFNVRHCIKSYTFPNGFTIEKGVDIYIPTRRFHLDSKLFPDPSAFKPERFIGFDGPSCAYMPFGMGPRLCIGMRFAILEMKMFVSKLVYNYDFTLDPKTELPVETDKWFFLRKIASPIHIKFTKRVR